MESLPGQPYVHIELDEEQVAKGEIKGPGDIFVTIPQWSAPHGDEPELVSLYYQMEFPTFSRYWGDYEVVRRHDGRYTVVAELIADEYLKAKEEEPELLDKALEEPPDFYYGLLAMWEAYLEYAAEHIKAYRPDFDYSASEENAKTLLVLLKKMEKAREGLREVKDHLETFALRKNEDVSPMKNPQRDVYAAILKDVYGRTNLEIAEALGVKSSKAPKNDSPTARWAVKRGRWLLEWHSRTDMGESWEHRAERLKRMRGG